MAKPPMHKANNSLTGPLTTRIFPDVPRSPNVHSALCVDNDPNDVPPFSHKNWPDSCVLRDYQRAVETFDRILEIDSEDLGAHYNLMLVYRKLGRNDDAKGEAKIFADLKDDPAALSLANQFLRKHPEMSNESVYWHVHALNRTTGE
jgi:tetratricopeptide (TPR) repeat protein